MHKVKELYEEYLNFMMHSKNNSGTTEYWNELIKKNATKGSVVCIVKMYNN